VASTQFKTKAVHHRGTDEMPPAEEAAEKVEKADFSRAEAHEE